MNKKRVFRIVTVVGLVLLLFFAFSTLTDDTRNYREVDTSVAMAQLADGNAMEAQIDDREQLLRLTLRDGIEVDGTEDVNEVMAQYPARGTDEVFAAVTGNEHLDSYNTRVTQDSFLMSMLGFLVPMLIFAVLIIWLFSRMQGGGRGGGLFGMGNSKAKMLSKEEPTATFADVAGADEAVQELDEIKDFLQHPARYQQLGAKIPRGVLLYGPPGTGKTLLARAVAGEAGVPFYTISGSDFVEMFVGVGASRVRDLFKQAKENAPCIIFIDEIDAVGRHRGSGTGGGHDEREQTLNQLLVEMDGFSDREDVIIMAATNRPDILDPALLRPGRFDRQIPVGEPDMKGREAILNVHAKDKPLADNVDLSLLAKRTAGMSGADLQNVLNEAALLTARVRGDVITNDALEEAVDRVVGGPRRTSKVISEHEKKVTAYHEGGHTLAAWALQDIERVYKVTILARGRTGGHAMTVPEDDKGMYNLPELFARLVFAMGGRAAEELVFGLPTTGASADIEQATKIARAMITEYGMSPTLGPVKYGTENGDPFSGAQGQGSITPSDSISAEIDLQVRELLEKAHREAYDILRDNRDVLDELAAKLLEKETLRRPDLEDLFVGIEPRERVEFFEEDEYFVADGRTPVKTPVELAIERGEEPPKPINIFAPVREPVDADNSSDQPASPNGAVAPAPHGENGTAGQPGGQFPDSPVYGGPPPPAGWTAPGWPRQDAPRYSGAPAEPQNSQPQSPRNPQGPQDQQAPYSPQGEHPGNARYGAPAEPQSHTGWERPRTELERPTSDSWERQQPKDTPTPEPRGFRLPDNEQPDRRDRPSDDDPHRTRSIPRVVPPRESMKPNAGESSGAHRREETSISEELFGPSEKNEEDK